jgi:23S rRNA (guanosine2251-2'-O)-methyltransferase
MSRGHHKENRDRDARESDIIFGRWPVKEALAAGGVIKLMIAKGAQDIDELMTLAREKNVPFHWLDRDRMNHMVPGNNQGVAAQISSIQFVGADDVLALATAQKFYGPSLIVLDGIVDPQNLGSILRSANFFGVPGVVIPKWRAASVTASVVRASAGAALKIPIAQVANLATFLESAKRKGLWVVGADMDGTDVKKSDVPRPFVLVMGSEGEGLHQLIRKKCDLTVSLKRRESGDGVSSLNVGVACAALVHALS